jgi:hypothetical protein
MGKPKGQDVVQAIFEQICTKVVENQISFKQAVDESEITLSTFYTAILKSDKNKDLYNYARNVRSDYLFEEIIEIADTQEEGTTRKEELLNVAGEDGNVYKVEIKRGDMTDHRRLRVDARKWVVARMNPKKYGDRLDVTTDGEKINQAPVNVVVDGIELCGKTISVIEPLDETDTTNK